MMVRTVFSGTATLCLTALGTILLLVSSPDPVRAQGDAASFDEVKRNVRETVRSMARYTGEQRDEAVAKGRAALQSLDTHIESLQNRIDENRDDMTEAARRQADETMQTLERLRVAASDRLESLSGGADDAWDHLAQGFSEALSALGDAWEKAVRELGSG